MISLFCLLPYFSYFSTAASLEMQDIYKELSWPLKLKILNEITDPEKKTAHMKLNNLAPMKAISRDAGALQPTAAEALLKPRGGAPIASAIEPYSQIQPERQVGIELLRTVGRRADSGEENDEKDMRLKLFRLMYETVRDSDLKVKRAELIKKHYANSSSFEIGYLVGDITDKANIITDISATLKRFHREWKPIEHINAYEQISNQAIEITHLIDLVRVVNKRDGDKNKR